MARGSVTTMARLTPLFSFLTHRPFLSSSSHSFLKHTFNSTIPTIATIKTLSQNPNSHNNDNNPKSTTNSINLSTKARRKAAKESPEGILQRKLNNCSKSNDVLEALNLYDEAKKLGVLLNIDHYNKLLYLCSFQIGDSDGVVTSVSELGLQRGFEIFQQMLIDEIKPNEATFTNAARHAAAKEDPEMAFELLKQMKSFEISPKLRSYSRALFGFCKKKDAAKAYENLC